MGVSESNGTPPVGIPLTFLPLGSRKYKRDFKFFLKFEEFYQKLIEAHYITYMTKKFKAILIDPPWKFKTWSPKGITTRSPENHYETLEKTSLKELPFIEWSDKNCALFMWTVDAHLLEALSLMETWDFQYKTIAFVWHKTDKKLGMGYWTRKGCEICLLGTKGKVPRKSASVRQIIQAPRREHSRKPDEIYKRIEQLVEGPYLEVFARTTWPNWTAWGLEIDKFNPTSPVS